MRDSCVAPFSSSPPPAPRSVTMSDAPQWLKRGGDPEEPLQTIAAQRMDLALREGGHWDLGACIIELAQEKLAQNSGVLHRSNRLKWLGEMITDWDGGKQLLLRLLVQIPVKILHSLIRNTLMADCVDDDEVYDWFNKHMRLNTSSTISGGGCYANVLCRPIQVDGIQYPGRFLTMEQIAELAHLARLYYDEPLDRKCVREIDGFVTGATKLPRHFSCEQYEKWLDRHDDLFVQDAPSVAAPYRRTPFEVGFTMDYRTRLHEHEKMQNSNALLGFTRACTARLGKGRLGLMQFVILRTTDYNRYLVSFSEIGATILTSSKISEGGYNSQDPGMGSLRKNSTYSKASSCWQPARRQVYAARPEMRDNAQLVLDHANTRAKLYEGLDELLTKRDSIGEATVRYEKARMAYSDMHTLRVALEQDNESLITGTRRALTLAEVQTEANAVHEEDKETTALNIALEMALKPKYRPVPALRQLIPQAKELLKHTRRID